MLLFILFPFINYLCIFFVFLSFFLCLCESCQEYTAFPYFLQGLQKSQCKNQQQQQKKTNPGRLEPAEVHVDQGCIPNRLPQDRVVHYTGGRNNPGVAPWVEMSSFCLWTSTAVHRIVFPAWSNCTQTPPEESSSLPT